MFHDSLKASERTGETRTCTALTNHMAAWKWIRAHPAASLRCVCVFDICVPAQVQHVCLCRRFRLTSRTDTEKTLNTFKPVTRWDSPNGHHL